MKINDTYTAVNIEKLSNQGYGIAKIDGIVAFIENSCPGDILDVIITKINKNYVFAKISKIIKPSESRVEPFCPMQKVCGACQIQFIDYDAQLHLKKEIVEDAMRNIGGFSLSIDKTIPSPQINKYRHKIQYPVSQTKNSKRIIAGYYKPASHEIVNIKYCPIQPEICDKIIEFIRENAKNCKISGYREKNHSGILRHVVIRYSEKNHNCLVTLVVNSKNAAENIKDFCRVLFDKFDEISGVCINLNFNKTNVIMGNDTICVCGKDYIEEELCQKTFHIGSDTFFQVNPKSAENIFNYIQEFIKSNYDSPIVLDAYAGISAIGICISDCAGKVVSIEENKKSVEMAIETAKLNNISNIEVHDGDAGEYFKNEKRKFDVVILDPPRKGCTLESLNYAKELCKGHIIYVSCNPATLARDLKILKEMNCEVESVQPFDMFCHTYHIENVAIIKVL